MDVTCHLCTIRMTRSCVFFFNDTATTEIYTLSLHDALPICSGRPANLRVAMLSTFTVNPLVPHLGVELEKAGRSEEHTSELQSLTNLVCRLLLEKKKKKTCRTVRGSTRYVI